ncbi:MAG: hypothetical protein ABFC24_05490 [Methanoregulaceae archaeon]
MKDNVRRALIFLVTVGAGSIFIFVDLPLIFMLPLLVLIGIVLLILMGSLSVAEISQGFRAIPQRIRGGKGKVPSKSAGKETPKQKKTPAVEKKGRFSAVFGSLTQGLKKIKVPAITKNAQDKKTKEINQKLDATLKPEKQSKKGTESGNAAGGAAAAAGGSGESADDEDPFLSLTGEDFEAGLLDELDDEDDSPGLSAGLAATDLPEPPEDVSEETGETPGELPEEGVDIGELEGVDAIDDELSSLDEIDLDAMELDDEEESVRPQKTAKKAAEKPAEPSAAPEQKKVEGNIGFDNAMMQEQIPEQIDVASMAGPAGSDDDMLSLLAAEAKIARKQDNDSLLRDLKDFRAPAQDIENELQDVMNLLGAKTGKKDPGKTAVAKEIVSGDE